MRDATPKDLFAMARTAIDWSAENAAALLDFGLALQPAPPMLVLNITPRANPRALNVIPINQALDPEQLREGLDRNLRGEPITAGTEVRRVDLAPMPARRGPMHN